MKKIMFLAEISSDARVESIVYMRGYYKLSLKDEYISTHKDKEFGVFYVSTQKEVREIINKIRKV